MKTSVKASESSNSRPTDGIKGPDGSSDREHGETASVQLSPGDQSQDTSTQTIRYPSQGLYPVLDGSVCLSRDPLEISYSTEIESSYREVTCTFTAHSRSDCLYTNVVDDVRMLDPDAMYTADSDQLETATV